MLEAKYIRHYGRKLVKTYRTELDDGIIFWVRTETTDGSILKDIFQSRVYEKYFAPTKGEVVADVGANSGCFTLRASRLVEKSGQVLAFEPFSMSFLLLQKHVKQNRCSNVSAFRIALGSKPGSASLNVYSSPGENSLYDRPSSTLWGKIRRIGSENVLVDTMDSMVKKAGVSRVDFMKIDTEGSELEVLKGATDAIKRYHPKIVAETHSFGSSVNDVIKFLVPYEYTIKAEEFTNQTGLLYAW